MSLYDVGGNPVTVTAVVPLRDDGGNPVVVISVADDKGVPGWGELHPTEVTLDLATAKALGDAMHKTAISADNTRKQWKDDQ